MEAPESVTANVDTRIGDGLRTLLNNGTELTGTVVGNDYQITVTKGQNIGFYSDSVDEYIVRFSSSNDSKFEFADYDETVNNSFGIDRTYRKTQKGHYFIVTALDDGIISVPSEAKDSIEIKSVTSPALKHNTAKAGQSYELKLADNWNEEVEIEDNYNNHDWLEFSMYNSDGTVEDGWFGMNTYFIKTLSKESNHVREVITSIVEDDVDVIYPYQYDTTAVTFTESKTPALKHNTVEAGESYEIKLSDSWNNKVNFEDNYHNHNWLEYSIYNSDGISNSSWFSTDMYYIQGLNKDEDCVREVITSIVDEDVDVAYPYEYDVKAVTFTESTAPALKRQTVKAKHSYEIKLIGDCENDVQLKDDVYGEWLEYAAYDAIGAVKYYGNSAWIQDLNKNANSIKEVITSTVDEDVDVTYPNEYDEKAITFIESTAPALARQIIELEKSYQIKLKEGQTVNPTFRADDFDIEYAIYKNNGECYKYGDDGNGAYIYREMSVSNGITDLVFTSKAEENKELIYPYEYGINMMTLSEIETPALLRKTIKTGHSYELKLVDENVNEFCLYNVTDVEYAIYGDDGQCSDFGKDYEYNNFILNRKYNETRLVITATGNVDYDVVIPAQYDNKVITFD